MSPRAEAVYRAMLAHRDWALRGIAEHLQLDEDQVKEALDELATLSLLAPAEAATIHVRPVNPKFGLSTLLAQAEAALEQQRHQVETARAAMASLAMEAAESASCEGFVHLRGVDAVRAHMESLATSVQFECVSINPVTAQSETAKRASKPLNELLLERGVRVRCLYQESFLTKPYLVQYAEWLHTLGAEIRTIPLVPSLLIIYDHRSMLVPIDPAETHLGAIEVDAPGIVNLAYCLFERLWESAQPLGQGSLRDDHGLTPMERQLLELLCAGHTDEVVARRLGVSLSTVRRLMARLMERLSARSRFQAGARAAELGWLRSMPASD
ncbi:MAG: LuxR C-terminal-related transcriptional regulator [Frankiaceae bacterium]